jgi:regulatory protein YycH of two-component signal transduction system YycFG
MEPMVLSTAFRCLEVKNRKEYNKLYRTAEKDWISKHGLQIQFKDTFPCRLF